MALTSGKTQRSAKSTQTIPPTVNINLTLWQLLNVVQWFDTEFCLNHIFQKQFYGQAAVDADRGKAFWRPHFMLACGHASTYRYFHQQFVKNKRNANKEKQTEDTIKKKMDHNGSLVPVDQ